MLRPPSSSPALADQIQTFIQSVWKKQWLVVFLLVILTFALRLKGITNTPTDWHAFRQADTASVTREYVKHGIDLLHPRYQDHSNIQSGKDNLEGYRMVEFPFINAGTAWILRTFPSLDLVVTSRMVALLFSLGTAATLYFLGKEWFDQRVGFFSALVFAVLPYARFYSRAILPESPFIFFMTASILFFHWWIHRHRIQWYVLSVASFALAMLLKPFLIFFVPVFAVMAIQRYGLKVFLHLELILYAALALLPFWWWRNWIANYPEGIPAYDWLFNSDKILFRPAWFRWLFLERSTKLILGWFGVTLAVVGMWPRIKTFGSGWLKIVVWWACILAYFIIIATGNVRHDYYQVIMLPILSLTVGLGMVNVLDWPVKWLKGPWQLLKLALVLLILFLGVKGSWYYIEGYYSTRPDWEKAGRAADALLPPDAKVIAPAFGDTAFLFQTNRTGWPIGFEIEKKIELGAEYYVTTAYDDEARELEKKYPTISKTPDYLILQLKK